jgi:hypothetical protein
MRHEPHIALFCQVLAGEARLEVVYQWMTAQTRLTEACTQRQDSEGYLSRESVSEAVREVFPGKSPAMCARLVSCVTSDGGERISLLKTLSPEESGRPSELALLLLDQQSDDTREMLQQFQSSLQESSDYLKMSEVETAIMNIDPAYPTTLLHSLLTSLYPNSGVTLPLPQITAHLAACGITRHSPYTAP